MRFKISEKDLEKALEKIEFKRSYPELVSKLINELQNKSGLIYSEIKNVRNIVMRNIKDILANHILIFKGNDLEYYQPIFGVDGSMVLIKGIGKKFFALISVSQVIFEKGLLDIENPRINLSVSMETIEEIYEVSPKTQAIIRMMIGESKAINILVNRFQDGFIFIDGPLIDPPNITDNNYVRYRSEVFMNALKTSVELIGFVKRYKSYQLSSKLELKESSHSSDQELIPILFSIIRKNDYCSSNDIIATKPYALSLNDYIYSRNVIESYREVLDELGVREFIYSSYVQVLHGLRPIKIEFFAKNNRDAEEKLKLLASLIKKISIAGTNLPLPILLAHKTSLIRKKVAEVLFREVISRILSYSSPDIDFQALRDMIYVSEG